MSILNALMADIYKADTDAERQVKRENITAEVRIHPETWYDLLADPQILPKHQLQPDGQLSIMGVPIKIDPNIEGWKLVTKVELIAEELRDKQNGQ